MVKRNYSHGVSVIALACSALIVPQVALAQSAGGGDVQADATDSDDAIIVTGRRAALQTAENRKRDAEVVVDSIVADEAGKLPDNSITEVLQRVAGVSIVRFASLSNPDRFSTEGSGIQVRGLSGVASRLNGREIFSANAGRSLLWGDVTPELMSAVDVYKSQSADMIEGGTGGAVDLRTKLPFDFDRGLSFAGSADISTGDLSDATDYSASGLIAGNWDTEIGRVGLLFDIAHSRLTSRSHFFRMEPYFRTAIGGTDYFIPGGYDFGEFVDQRDRDGLYGAIQWAPTDALRLTAIYFQSEYDNRNNEWGSFVVSQNLSVNPANSEFDSSNGLIFSPAVFQRDPTTFNPSNGPIFSGGVGGSGRSRTKTKDLSFEAEWAPVDSPLSVRGSFQRVQSQARTDSLAIFRDFQFPTTFSLDLRGDLPVVGLPDGFDDEFLDPKRYLWTAAMPHNENNLGVQKSAQVDLEYDLGDGFFNTLQVGGRWAKRTERDLNNGYAWAALGRSWNGDPQLTYANAAPGDVELHTFDNFFRGDIPLPAEMLFPSTALSGRMDVAGLFSGPPAGFCGELDWGGGNPDYFDCSPRGALPQSGYGGSPGRTPGFILPDDESVFETETLAAYAKVRFSTLLGDNELTGNAGVRYVHVDNSSAGYFKQFQSQFFRNGQTFNMANLATVRSGGAEFDRFLPAINLTYSIGSDVKLRGAYNITMDNASFYALRANGDVFVSTTTNPLNPPPPLPALPGLFTAFTTNSGNPTLKPAMSNNFDFSAEWYARPGTMFHVAGFYKRLTNLPIYAKTQQPVTITYTDGTVENAFANATDSTNATEAATVLGFEVGGRMFFDMLPGWLAGFGVEGNYTYIDSKNPGDLYRDIYGVERNDAPLQGLSTHNYNLSLMYERNPFSVRLSYSWRSDYLQSTNSNGTNPTYSYYATANNPAATSIALPVYGDAYGQVDGGVTFRITPQVSVFLQGTNLLGAKARTLMGGYDDDRRYVRSWFVGDRRITSGINVAF